MASGGDDPVHPRSLGACPTCGKPAVQASRPFCSGRCADFDLQRWLTERYVIPVEDQDEAEAPPEDDAGQVGRSSL